MTVRTVTVRRRLKASAADLFATLTEPDRFARVRGIRGIEIVTEGPHGPASAGTVRRVSLPVGFLLEEIVAVEAPHQFDYLIRDAALPMDHRFGRIEFRDSGDHTEATWTSTLAFDRPLIGAVAGPFVALVSHLGFGSTLREIDRVATADPAANTIPDSPKEQ